MPDYQDEVKHTFNDVTGIVIAVYEIKGTTYFDVRSDDHIYYATPATNWRTVSPADE